MTVHCSQRQSHAHTIAGATGAVSLQNALDTGVALLRNIPPYGHREMLVGTDEYGALDLMQLSVCRRNCTASDFEED